MTNENFEELIFASSERLNDNVLNIMPEIKSLSGDEAGKKIFNKFLYEDKYAGFKRSRGLLNGTGKFRLVIPRNKPSGLNPQQIDVLQCLYVKHRVVGDKIQGLKDQKLFDALNGKKVMNISKTMCIDFRKAYKSKK